MTRSGQLIVWINRTPQLSAASTDGEAGQPCRAQSLLDAQGEPIPGQIGRLAARSDVNEHSGCSRGQFEGLVDRDERGLGSSDGGHHR